MPLAHVRSETASVRADLDARVAALGQRLGQFPAGEIARELDVIRTQAQRHGLRPAVAVIHALESALARGETGPLVRGWMQLLRDAIGCERDDTDAGDVFGAACSVRFGG